jgi:hypothetical protein
MLVIRDHGVADYAALLDMDATDVGALSEDDRACLDEIGEYLGATDAWQRFAMWLLHKHFEPADGEVFVERALPEEAKTEATLVDRSSAEGLSAMGIRFGAEVDSELGVVGMEFAERADFGSIAPLGADDETVLAGIAELLRDHGRIDRVGVKLIRNPLGLSERQLLLETCDSENRTLHCDVSSRDTMPGDVRIVETTWQWKVVHRGVYRGRGQPRPQTRGIRDRQRRQPDRSGLSLASAGRPIAKPVLPWVFHPRLHSAV